MTLEEIESETRAVHTSEPRFRPLILDEGLNFIGTFFVMALSGIQTGTTAEVLPNLNIF